DVATDPVEARVGSRRMRGALAADGLDQDANADELLAHVVVEIEAEPPALFLADHRLMAREAAQALLAPPQGVLGPLAGRHVAGDAAHARQATVWAANAGYDALEPATPSIRPFHPEDLGWHGLASCQTGD